MESSSNRISELWNTQVTKLRWTLGLRGVLAIAVGIVILVWPGISLVALTALGGAYAPRTGSSSLATRSRTRASRRLVRRRPGSRGAGAGLGHPVARAPVRDRRLRSDRSRDRRGIPAPLNAATPDHGLGGLVAIMFGIVMFAKPGAGALATLALIAAFALVTGVTQLVVAISGKQVAEHKAKKLITKRKTQPSH